MRVVVVDEIPLLRCGVTAALAPLTNLRIVDEGATFNDAIKLSTTLRPELAVVGLSETFDALSLAALTSQSAGAPRVVCIVPIGKEEMIPDLLKAGAKGCVSRSARPQELVRCVEAVSGGGSYVSPALVAGVLKHPVNRVQPVKVERRPSLTQKEARILELVAEGQSNKDIAAALTLSEKTVKRYMTLIMQKINVRNRLQAALYLSDGNR